MDTKTYRKICMALDFKRYGYKLVLQVFINLLLSAVTVYLLSTDNAAAYIIAQMIIPVVFSAALA